MKNASRGARTAGTAPRDGAAALGRAIRALRRERGMTRVQLAAAAGLSQPFLSQLELGRSRPSMRSLSRIATALGTTQQTLLGVAGGDRPGELPGGPVRGGGEPLLVEHRFRRPGPTTCVVLVVHSGA